MLVAGRTVILVEYMEQALETIAGTTLQVRNLYDDAVVGQTFDKGIFLIDLLIIVIQISDVYKRQR